MIPYVVQRLAPVPGTTKSLLVTYFNLTTVDAADPTRLAIYSSIEFLRKFPDKIRAGFGHELAHVLVEKEALRDWASKDLDLYSDPGQAEDFKELRKDEIVELFPEPLRGEVKAWDKLSRDSATARRLLRDALVMDSNQFDDDVLHGRLEELADQKGTEQ